MQMNKQFMETDQAVEQRPEFVLWPAKADSCHRGVCDMDFLASTFLLNLSNSYNLI